jgi:carbon monoxide dehydrogenase subunit G
MKIQGEYVFDGSREEVWDLVRDPEVLATALPGTQSLERISDTEYAGKMNVRIGPVAGVFAGRLIVENEVPPESYTLNAEGRGAPGFAKGVGNVKLVEQEDGKTLMEYEGDMQIGGRLANAGQRLIDTASKSMIAQGLETLNAALVARREAAAEGKEVEYVPPSETQFAAAVAKDMAREMLPPPEAMGVVLLAAAIAFVLGFLLGRMGGE